MSLRISFKLYGDEISSFQHFADQIRNSGEEDAIRMSREEIAKQAVFYAISDAYTRAAQMQRERISNVQDTEPAVTKGDSETEQSSRPAGSDALPHEKADGADAGTVQGT